MRRIIVSSLALGALFAAGAAPAAERYALVIANHEYVEAPAAHAARGDADVVERALKEAGFEVARRDDLDRQGMQDAIRELEAQAGRHQTLVVFYSGHALRMGRRTMLAPVDASNATLTDATMSTAPLPLLLTAAAEASETAVVFVDAAQLAGFTPAAYAEPGIAEMIPPPGVLVVAAAPPREALERGWWNKTSDFSRTIVERFMAPGASVAKLAAEGVGGVWSAGVIDAALSLAPAPVAAAGDGGKLDKELELALWQAAERTGSRADYQAYLDRFPNGVFAGIARNRIAAAGGRAAEVPKPTTPTPPPAPDTDKAIEDGLGLSRAQRVEIQRDLTQLGYDTRGVDGVFGPGTRNSLKLWQQSRRYPGTGYLTRQQIDDLAAEARADAEAKRVAEERRRAEQAAEDDAAWRDARTLGTMAAYSSYLSQYPDGRNAGAAQDAIDRLLADQRRNAAAQDRAAWEAAERENRPQSYRDYLALYPNGAFADLARQRVDEFEADLARRDRERTFREREASMRLSGDDVLSLEQRLAYLGFHPGNVDGRIDLGTRQAVREYQRDRGLEASGYFDNPTVTGIVRETSRPGDPRSIIAGEALRGILNLLGN